MLTRALKIQWASGAFGVAILMNGVSALALHGDLEQLVVGIGRYRHGTVFLAGVFSTIYVFSWHGNLRCRQSDKPAETMA